MDKRSVARQAFCHCGCDSRWGDDPQSSSLAALLPKVAAWDRFHNEAFLISQAHEVCLHLRPSGEFLALGSSEK